MCYYCNLEQTQRCATGYKYGTQDGERETSNSMLSWGGGVLNSSSKYSKRALHQWEWLGQAKICLKYLTKSEMLEMGQQVNEG